LVPILWVFVRDREGTHRDEYFYSTNAGLSTRQTIEFDTGRKNIETTFQKVRSCLHLGTAGGWCRRTVIRVTPCWFGLDSMVASLDNELPAARRVGAIRSPGKTGLTLSDALTALRRWIWADGVFHRSVAGRTSKNSHSHCASSCTRLLTRRRRAVKVHLSS
jgi:hypothetical protein